MNLNYFIKNDIVINCVTNEEAHRFMDWIHENSDEQWHGDIWGRYGSKTCYRINATDDVTFASKRFYTGALDLLVISLDEFFDKVGYDQPELPAPKSIKTVKVYGIRSRETGEMFIGRKGVQTFWEKPGAIKGSFYHRTGVSFNNQQEWELVTYNCVEVI